jgi:hypothetical protein
MPASLKTLTLFKTQHHCQTALYKYIRIYLYSAGPVVKQKKGKNRLPLTVAALVSLSGEWPLSWQATGDSNLQSKIVVDFFRQNCKIAGFNVYWTDSADGCFLILIQKEQVIWAVRRNR